MNTQDRIDEAVRCLLSGLELYHFPPEMAIDLAMEGEAFKRDELLAEFERKYPGKLAHFRAMFSAVRDDGRKHPLDCPAMITARCVLPTM